MKEDGATRAKVSRIAISVLYLVAPVVELGLCFWGPHPLESVTAGDIPYFVLLFLHLLFGVLLLLVFKFLDDRTRIWYIRVPEVLFSLTLLLFLFSFIYALNANMDYVQRFIATSGNLRLAQDTRVEQVISLIRYAPMLSVSLIAFGLARWESGAFLRRVWKGPPGLNTWAFPLTLLSVALSVVAFPSFIHSDGLPFLAYAALVPLLLVFGEASYGWSVFYGVCYGVFTNLLINYWLGPYSLISLQVTIIVFFLFYILFMPAALWLFRKIQIGRFLVFPLAWVLFDYLRSVGFLGYPWGFLGYTQYAFLPLIQMASVTGVWGVSFVVLLLNSSFAQVLSEVFPRYRHSRESSAGGQPGLAPVYVSAGVFVASVFAGAIYLSTDVYTNPYVQGRSVRIALVQQNSDPRKHNYERTFQTLRRLTDQAKAENPDLIAWSETAFVPNIRRWSREDPRVYPLAGLVREFLGYQKSLGLWLVTGNDDYDLIENEKGEQVRLDYNASVLFSPNGERVATYHKVHLVPFTEHFPYKKQFPWFYELLLNFDVTLWEPGGERRVFSHPLFCFATPICFEDTFPGDMRKFVLNGAEVILNLSNDYWSLTEVEAKQHYVSSLFRAVENRRPLLRSTASGFTAYADPSGRFVRGLPFFEEDYLVVDVGIEPRGISVYTRYGDWFPIAAFLGLLLLGSLNLKKKLSLPKKKA